ncbi:MAG: glycerophosphodiester phosphodiesterase [Chloroflexales bacterium]|nr:glycerophosphodiester phosphodiesterase [Chloroflexales bacterium]
MTLVIAHRGASAHAPENTLRAFALAHTQGADMIELDVHRSADGALVVFHDNTTERWDGRTRAVADCTLADLRALDIGGEQVPTLDETCAFARDAGIALNVELKQPDIVPAAVALLRRYDIARTTTISSFYPEALAALQRHAPDISAGYLMGTETYRPDVRLRELWPLLHLRAVGARAWHPYFALPALARVLPLVRRAGYAVHVWTVDDPTVARQLAALGASGIITNAPDLIRAALRET